MKNKRSNGERNDQLKLLLKLYKLESNGNGVGKGGTLRKLERSLDPTLFRRYQWLKQRKGTAIAVLRRGVCSGCQMVYPESHEIMKTKNFIRVCEYCGRLLVVTDKSSRASVA